MKVVEMRQRRDINRPRLVELGLAPEVWVDGFGNVESLGGGVYRIPLYKIHRPADGVGPDEHEIVAFVLANLSKMASGLTALKEELAESLLLPAGIPLH